MFFLPLLLGLAGAGAGAALAGSLALSAASISMAASIGWALGSAIGSALAAPGSQNQHGPRIQDLTVQSATYGVPIKHVFGQARIAGNVIWTPGIKETQHRDKKKVGSFFGIGGTKIITYTYTYSASLAISICEGPIDAVRRIWADGKLIYDARVPLTTESTQEQIDSGELQSSGVMKAFESGLAIYLGTEEQTTDPTMRAQSFVYVTDENGNRTQQTVDSSLHPAYRGLCYVVFTDFALEEYGNRIPQFEFEVVKGPRVYPADSWNIFDPNAEDYAYRPGSMNEAVFSADGQYLIAGFGHTWQFAVYSVATKELLYTAGGYGAWGSGEYGHIAIDEWGYLYKWWFVSGNKGRLFRIDYRTGEIEASADGGNGGAVDIHVIDELGLVAWTTLLGSSLNTVQLAASDPNADPQALAYDERPMLLGSNHALPKRGRMIAHDPYGHVFVACFAGSGTPYLFISKLGNTGVPNPNGYTTQTGTFDLSATISAAHFVTYVAQDHTLLIAGHSTPVIKWDLATATVLATTDFNTGVYQHSQWKQGPVDGALWVSTSIEYKKLDVLTLEVLQTESQIDYDGTLYTQSAFIYDRLNNAFWTSSPAYKKILYLDRVSPDGVPLSEVIAEICSWVDLENPADIDVVPLAQDTVKGYVIDNQMTARKAIEPLQLGYFFDAVESDDRIKFVKRGGSAAATVLWEDLAAHDEGSERPSPLLQVRQQETELPREVAIEYIDSTTEYERGVQRAQRLTTASKEMRTVVLPILFHPDTAKQISEVSQYLLWTERTRYNIRLPISYLRLDPTDVIDVQGEDGADTYSLIITRANLTGNGVIEIEGVAEDAAVYVSTSTGATATKLTNPGQVITGPGESLVEVVRVPDLEGQSIPPGVYLAVGGLNDPSWPGATVKKTCDGGATWQTIGTFTEPSTFGHAETTLKDGSPWIWDRGGSVIVSLKSGGPLVSASEDAVLLGTNYAYLGNEIIQFASVEALGNNRYKLSNLLRARGNTDAHTATHVVGERFVLLDTDLYKIGELTDGTVGEQCFYRATTLGTPSYQNATGGTGVTNDGSGSLPSAPGEVRVKFSGQEDLIVSWDAKSGAASYVIDAADTATGETLLSLTSATTTATFPGAYFPGDAFEVPFELPASDGTYLYGMYHSSLSGSVRRFQLAGALAGGMSIGDRSIAMEMVGDFIYAIAHNSPYDVERLVKIDKAHLTVGAAPNYAAIYTPPKNGEPQDLVYDGTDFWTSLTYSGQVIRLDSTLTQTATVTIGTAGTVAPAALETDGASVWVADRVTHKVHRINSSTQAIDLTFSVVEFPSELKLISGNLWVLGRTHLAQYNPGTGAQTVTPIDINAGDYKHLDIGTWPNGPMAKRLVDDGHYLIVVATGGGNGRVLFLDRTTGTVLYDLPVLNSFRAVGHLNNTLYVMNMEVVMNDLGKISHTIHSTYPWARKTSGITVNVYPVDSSGNKGPAATATI